MPGTLTITSLLITLMLFHSNAYAIGCIKSSMASSEILESKLKGLSSFRRSVAFAGGDSEQVCIQFEKDGLSLEQVKNSLRHAYRVRKAELPMGTTFDDFFKAYLVYGNCSSQSPFVTLIENNKKVAKGLIKKEFKEWNSFYYAVRTEDKPVEIEGYARKVKEGKIPSKKEYRAYYFGTLNAIKRFKQKANAQGISVVTIQDEPASCLKFE